MKALLSIAITIALLAFGASALVAQSGNDLFQQALVKERTDGNMTAAIALYQTIVEKHSTDRALVARALVQMGGCYEKLSGGDAVKTYERVVREFGDQVESAATARMRLTALQALAAPQRGHTVRLLWNDLGRWLGNSGIGPPSPDGRYVSFTGRAANLAVLDLRAGETLSLTDNQGTDNGYVETSAVSPDGRYVAYDWDLGDARKEELRLVALDPGRGFRSRSFPVGQSFMNVLGWSPDGKSVLVTRDVREGTRITADLVLVSIADGRVRVLKENVPSDEEATLSPDGRFLAYSKPNGANGSDIFVLTLNDGKETPVVESPGNDRDPIWAPDGRHIVFRSNRNANRSLWMVPVDGGSPLGPALLVKDNIGSMYPLGFTRSGALYYALANAVTNVCTMDAGFAAASTPSIATTLYTNANSSGVWSPDGKLFAYNALTPGGILIRVRTVSTGRDRPVPFLMAVSGPVRWFPDSQSLLVASRDTRLLNGQLGYYRVSVTDGHADLLHQTAAKGLEPTRPDLSADGKTMVYLETPEQPVSVDLQSGRATRLTPVASRLSLALSPDASTVAYVGAGSLGVAPAGGGEARQLAGFSESSYARERADGLGLAWSADQRHVFFVQPNIRAIWRVPSAGGEAEKVWVSPNRIRALRVHPDGSRIAFDSVVDAWELWALENFLPNSRVSR